MAAQKPSIPEGDEEYSMLKDLRISLEQKDGAFSLCLWIYLSNYTLFPATIIRQVLIRMLFLAIYDSFMMWRSIPISWFVVFLSRLSPSSIRSCYCFCSYVLLILVFWGIGWGLIEELVFCLVPICVLMVIWRSLSFCIQNCSYFSCSFYVEINAHFLICCIFCLNQYQGQSIPNCCCCCWCVF